MKNFVLAAVAVLSFAAVSQAEVPRCDDSRDISTLPAGTQIYTGQAIKIMATTTSSQIGTSSCTFRFTSSGEDRVTEPNMLLTSNSGDNGDPKDSSAKISAQTSSGQTFDIVCDKKDSGHKDDYAHYYEVYTPMTVGDFERALESVGGQMILPAPEAFQQ